MSKTQKLKVDHGRVNLTIKYEPICNTKKVIIPRTAFHEEYTITAQLCSYAIMRTQIVIFNQEQYELKYTTLHTQIAWANEISPKHSSLLQHKKIRNFIYELSHKLISKIKNLALNCYVLYPATYQEYSAFKPFTSPPYSWPITLHQE